MACGAESSYDVYLSPNSYYIVIRFSGPIVIMIQTLVMLIMIELVLMIMIDLVMVLVIMTMVKSPPQYQGDLLR